MSYVLEKNGFAEIPQNLIIDTDPKIILLDHQNNYIGCLNMMTMLQKISNK